MAKHISQLLILVAFISFGQIARLDVGDVSAQEELQKEVQDQNRFLIYPKRSDIKVERTGTKNESEQVFISLYPDGRAPVHEASGIEGDSYLIVVPHRGKAARSDYYTLHEMLSKDVQEVVDSNDVWLKFTCAAAFADASDHNTCLYILRSLSQESQGLDEVRILSSRSKRNLRLYDSAIADLAPFLILNHPSRYQRHVVSQARLARAIALMKSERYEEALKELTEAFILSEGLSSDIQYLRSVCNYMLRNYDDVIEDLNVRIPDTEELKKNRAGKLWILCRSLVMNDPPDYDSALELLDAEKYANPAVNFLAKVDAALIYSTRPDIDKRNATRALEILNALKNDGYFDLFIKDYSMAEALAYLETGNYEKASTCMKLLKDMLVSQEDFPDLKAIEASISQKRRYVPSKVVPLGRERNILNGS